MSHDREWQFSRVALGLAGLIALGCGIAERRVEERSDDGRGGTGLDAGRAGFAGQLDAGRGGEATIGGGAGRNAAGGKGGSGVTSGSGHELDPVEVGDVPIETQCACGGGCPVEKCEVETVGQPGEFLMNVFVRHGQAYWMSQRSLGRVNLATAANTSMATELLVPSCVVVGDSFAYFSSYQGLWQVPRDASAVSLNGAGANGARLLSTLSPWQRRLTEITVDSQDLYWTSPGGGYMTPQLERTPVGGGGGSVTLARLPNEEDWPLGLAVDDTHVYFTSNAALQRVPKAGGTVERLEPIGSHVDYAAIHPTLGIALDRDYIYYDAGRALVRRHKREADATEIFEPALGGELRGVVLDRDYAYVGTTSGDIYRVSKREGIASLMVSGEQNPRVTAIDASHVYWVEEDLGRIRRASK